MDIPVPRISVTNSRMKYEKLIEKARIENISNTFVIGGMIKLYCSKHQVEKMKKQS